MRTMTCGVVMTALTLVGLSGCAAGGAGGVDPDSYEAVKDIHGGPHTDMMLVILTTGPASATQSKEEATARFKGHMSNMQRLAEAGVLLIAGPFNKPRNPSWRGIFVLDTSSVRLARLQVETDPAVAAGVFVPVYVPVKGSIELRRASELEKAMLAERGDVKPEPGSPPPTIKPYVLVSADDGRAALAGLNAAGLGENVRFALNTSGTRKGLIAVDAPAERVLSALAGVKGAEMDGWFSTASLAGLGEAARTLPR